MLDKLKFLNNYKFNICCENSQRDMYITEKILDAYLANEKYIDLMPSYSQIVIDLETDEELKKEYLKDVYALRNYENKEELTDEDKEKIAEHKKNIRKIKQS